MFMSNLVKSNLIWTLVFSESQLLESFNFLQAGSLQAEEGCTPPLFYMFFRQTEHDNKNMKFFIKDFLVNVTKSTDIWELIHIYRSDLNLKSEIWRNPQRKTWAS